MRSHKETKFCNANYGIRHPLAIHNVSIGAVIENLSNLLTCLEQFQKERPAGGLSSKEKNHALIVATDQYLDSLMEHLDDCLSIIKTMFPHEEDKKYKKVCRSFKQGIGTFRDHIAKQVNFIKHRQARIRLVAFYNDTISLLGYYIEGVFKDGIVGPHPEIHPMGNSAFSYNREVRFSICGLLFVSELLADNVGRVLHGKTGAAPKTDDDKFRGVVDRVSQLPFMFFPDEYSKPVPLILRTSNQRIIRYPSQFSRPQRLPSQLNVKAEVQTDGVSDAYKIPYFGKGI